MNPIRLPDHDPNLDANLDPPSRLERLTRCRAMQRNLDFELRQQISRRRLLALHRDSICGWVPL